MQSLEEQTKDAQHEYTTLRARTGTSRSLYARSGRSMFALVIIVLLTVFAACGGEEQNPQNQEPQLSPEQQTAAALAQIENATKAARATSIYVSTNYPFSTDLVLEDALKTNTANSSGVPRWMEDETCAFGQGKYLLNATSGVQNSCAAQGENFKIFSYEVEISNIDGSSGAGIVFRYKHDLGQYFAFVVNPDNTYSFFVHTTEDAVLATGELTSPLPDSFRLGVADDGTTVRFFLDGVQVGLPVAVGQYNTMGLDSGSVGMLLYSASGTGGSAAFANVKVWKLAEGGR